MRFNKLSTQDGAVYYKLAVISLALGVIILSQAYLLGYKGNLNYELFWIGILFAVVPTLIAILKTDNQIKIMVLLFSFGVFLYLPIIFWSPTYFRFQDEIDHFNYLTLIIENGNLDITPTLEIIKYYPGIDILNAFLAKVSGLDIFVSAKLLILIIHSFVLVFVYILVETITSSKRTAALGSFIYAGNPSYAFFDAVFSYESLGILLVVALIYAICKREILNKNKFSFSIISLILLGSLVITHHFSSYMFSIFLIISIFIYFLFIHKIKISTYESKFIIRFTIVTVVLILAWVIYHALATVKYFGGMLSESISSLLAFLVEGAKIQREPFWQSQLPKYEIVIDTYLYIPLLFLLYVYCIYLVTKNFKKNSIYTLSLVSYGFLFFVSLSLIFTQAGQLFMYRTWAFTSIGLSFSVGLAAEKLLNHEKNFKIAFPALFAVIFIVIGGISIGSSSSVRDPNFNSASVPSSITLDVIHASNWFAANFGKNNIILGDSISKYVFGGYGQQMVINDPYLFYKESIDSASIDYLHNSHQNFIVFDNRMTQRLSDLKYYFDKNELKKKDHKWGYTEVLPKRYLEKFNSQNAIYKIYDNKNINIYYVDRGRLN